MKLAQMAFLACFLAMAPAALAQEDSSLYQVADIAVDVSAASAAQARNDAIPQAQRHAFKEILSRLNAGNIEASDDEIAALVQSFEVQKEHAAALRYMGTFTVQFKPMAVRAFLNAKGTAFSEIRAKPIVILPLLKNRSRVVLWEDRTAWRNAWEEAARKAVLVPMIGPAGDLEDIAQISAEEAVSAKAENLRSLMRKYQASGAIVAILETGDELSGTPIDGTIILRAYDSEGLPRDVRESSLKPSAAYAGLDDELRDGIEQMIRAIEGEWKQAQASGAARIVASPGAAAPAGTQMFLPVDVPVANLAAWGKIRDKLARVPLVVETHVIAMTRGLVHIEVQFTGDLASLQSALAEQGLRLEQSANGSWSIQQTGAMEAL